MGAVPTGQRPFLFYRTISAVRIQREHVRVRVRENMRIVNRSTQKKLAHPSFQSFARNRVDPAAYLIRNRMRVIA